MYLLDTSVLSLLDPRRGKRHAPLLEWLERNGAAIHLSVISITELDAGILKLRRERKHKRADELAGLVRAIERDFADRVLPVDLGCAHLIAELAEKTHKQPVALADLIIAATALRHGQTVLTSNMKDFAKLPVPVLDPSVQLPPG